jgi:hypothetical protein
MLFYVPNKVTSRRIHRKPIIEVTWGKGRLRMVGNMADWRKGMGGDFLLLNCIYLNVLNQVSILPTQKN